MMTALLERAVRADPAKIAIVYGEERISYEELQQRVDRCAAGLRGLGIGEGDCMAVVLHNCPEFIVAFFACSALGAIFLPLNPQYTREELQRFLLDGEAKAVIAASARIAALRELPAQHLHEWPLISVGRPMPGFIPFAELLAAKPGFAPRAEYRGRALYLYTSGSTDTYKRVCCTQENLYYEAHNFVETAGLSGDDTILCTIPLYHSYGIGNCLLDAAYLGATLVILEPAVEDQTGGDAPFLSRCPRVAELFRVEKIRFYPGVPYQFSVLGALPAEFPIDLGTVRLCTSSGDVLSKQTYDRFLARFGHPIRSLYGSTEAGSIAINLDPKPKMEFGPLGLPLKNVTIAIRGRDGSAVPDGQEGEIWVKSPTLPPSGYDNRAELSAVAFRDGYYNAGDLGRKNERGQLVMTGRKQSFVDIAGYKVDIAEVEEVLQSCPGVREAAALCVEVPRMGMLIKAVIVPQGNCREADIRAYCRDKLSFFKVPRLIEMRDALPRSAIGKVLKSELSGVTAYLDDIRGAEAARILAQLPRASAVQRNRLLATLVQAQAAAVLERSPSEVSRNLGFTELGMDSFASIELRVRLEYLLERELSETLTFDHPTVAAVVEYLDRFFATARRT
jgi:long-chain acyl-CoA synthetase